MKQAILLSVYFLAVIAGAILIVLWRGTSVQLVATRNLPAEHLLKEGDLQLVVDGRQYLTRAVKPGDRVDSKEIKTLHDALGGNNRTPIALDVDPAKAPAGGFVPGYAIVVCPSDVRATVVAAHCGAPQSLCVVVAEVATADAAKLTGANVKPSLRQTAACE
jgi:hypothetical protein